MKIDCAPRPRASGSVAAPQNAAVGPATEERSGDEPVTVPRRPRVEPVGALGRAADERDEVGVLRHPEPGAQGPGPRVGVPRTGVVHAQVGLRRGRGERGRPQQLHPGAAAHEPVPGDDVGPVLGERVGDELEHADGIPVGPVDVHDLGDQAAVTGSVTPKPSALDQ